MASDEEIRATIGQYLEAFSAGDRERWLGLFADDATVEDPVGSPSCKGRREIGEFWDRTHALAADIALVLVQGPGVCGHEAAFAMEARTELGDQTFIVPTIDVMTFDHDGRITSQRAFWDAKGMVTG